MKLIFTFIILIFSQLNFASDVLVGCNEQKLLCLPDGECIWMTNIGQAGEVHLILSYSGADYELWIGSFSGIVYGQYPFNVGITQKVNLGTGEKENFLNVQLEVDGSEIYAFGKSQVSAKYKKGNFGVGFICNTELTSAESDIQ